MGGVIVKKLRKGRQILIHFIKPNCLTVCSLGQIVVNIFNPYFSCKAFSWVNSSVVPSSPSQSWLDLPYQGVFIPANNLIDKDFPFCLKLLAKQRIVIPCKLLKGPSLPGLLLPEVDQLCPDYLPDWSLSSQHRDLQRIVPHHVIDHFEGLFSVVFHKP